MSAEIAALPQLPQPTIPSPPAFTAAFPSSPSGPSPRSSIAVGMSPSNKVGAQSGVPAPTSDARSNTSNPSPKSHVRSHSQSHPHLTALSQPQSRSNSLTQLQAQAQPQRNSLPSEFRSQPRLPPPLAAPSKPRIPRSESFNPPSLSRPPHVRAAFSTYSSDLEPKQSRTQSLSGGLTSAAMFRHGSGENDIDEKEELTTKGRKRKRLAKACSACHKNKRRCDGFAPCSNCEFSSRPCLYLNAQGEPIPPPRTRETSATPQRPKDETQLPATTPSGASDKREEWRTPVVQDERTIEPERPDMKAPNDLASRRGSERRGWANPLEAVDRDLALSIELNDIFFKRAQPFGTMIHYPTFQHRLYLGQVSPILVDVMNAFAARLSNNPALLTSLPVNHPSHARGEIFAERAHVSLKRILSVRSTWTEEAKARDRGTYEETELIQAMYLLSVYYASTKQPSLGNYYLDLCTSFLHPTTSATLVPPASHLQISTTEYLTLLETRQRTFWLIVLHDLCIASSVPTSPTSGPARSRRLADHEIYNIPLPGDELQWSRYGAVGSAGRDCGRRDGLAVGTGNWPGDEGSVGEMGHVLRILLIFSEIMAVANGTDGKHYPAGHHEQALKLWALSLPRHLRFDEHNLAASILKLASPIPGIVTAGFLYAYMHAIAECGMFYLQAAVGSGAAGHHGHDIATAQRQAQAVDNIAVVLDAVGEKGRESCLMHFPLLVVTNWQEHLRSSGNVSSSAQVLLDDKIALWWSEAKRDWGVDPPRSGIVDGPPSASTIFSAHPMFDARRESHTSTSIYGHGRQLVHPQPQPLLQPVPQPLLMAEVSQDRREHFPPSQSSGTRSRSQSLINQPRHSIASFSRPMSPSVGHHQQHLSGSSRPSPAPTPTKMNQRLDPGSSSSLGLYTKGDFSTSPRDLPLPESAVSGSSNSSSNVALPTPGSFKFGATGSSVSTVHSLPPLSVSSGTYRPRAHSTLELGLRGESGEYGRERGRDWDDIIGVMREKDEKWKSDSVLGLPPTPTSRNVVDKEREREKEKQREKERYNPYSLDQRNHDKRRDTWWAGDARKSSPRGSLQGYSLGGGSEYGHKSSLSREMAILPQREEVSEKEKDKMEVDNKEPLGIAALISAAEERARERTETVA